MYGPIPPSTTEPLRVSSEAARLVEEVQKLSWPRDVVIQSGRKWGRSRIATGITAQWPGLAEAAVEGAHQP